MRTRNRIFATSTAVAVVALSVVACAPTTPPEQTGLTIVASTNVWGDIAQSVAGDNATVTSIITSASQDPHSYEATARDQLAISQAALVIENGGGYDPFIDTLLAAAGNAETVVVLNASEASGLMPEEEHAEDEHAEDATADDAAAEEGHAEHAHVEGFNEHVWYSFEGVDSVAKELATELSTIDPDNAVEYEANYQALSSELAALTARATDIGAEVGGQKAAITEPVPLYLLDAVALVNATPEEFSEAFEEGIDIPPTALRDTLALFANGDVVLLAYNDQVTSAQGEQVLTAATSAGVAVVAFAETLPEGQDYLEWMSANLEAVAEALAL